MDATARPPAARHIAVALAALLLGSCAGPQRKVTNPSPERVARRVFPVLDHGGLDIEVPDGWDVKMIEVEPGTPASIRLDAPGGGTLFLVLLYNPDPPVGAPGLETAREFAELALGKAIPMVLGPEPVLRELESRDGVVRGYWFEATDKTYAPPGPGQQRWRNMLRGAISVGQLLVSFTWFDDWPGPSRSEVLEMLAEARHADRSPTKAE